MLLKTNIVCKSFHDTSNTCLNVATLLLLVLHWEEAATEHHYMIDGKSPFQSECIHGQFISIWSCVKVILSLESYLPLFVDV